jgi:hypothetical protein
MAMSAASFFNAFLVWTKQTCASSETNDQRRGLWLRFIVCNAHESSFVGLAKDDKVILLLTADSRE